ncbi:MAG: hypothetical protein HGA78_06430 [Nitrospirales bacterium]|nr:hypothetical protein [Nitrospirales bacterium]
MIKGSYEIEESDGRLLFRTASFRPGKGSILHSNIYNRELASSMAAGTLVMVVSLFLSAVLSLSVVSVAGAVLLFVCLFLFFRKVVFRENLLELRIDREKGEVGIAHTGFAGRTVSYPLSGLEDLLIARDVVELQNKDAIAIVEHVAAHHGTVISGFGDRSEYYTVEMRFSEGKTTTVFSSEKKEESDTVLSKIQNFLSVRSKDAKEE